MVTFFSTALISSDKLNFFDKLVLETSDFSEFLAIGRANSISELLVGALNSFDKLILVELILSSEFSSFIESPSIGELEFNGIFFTSRLKSLFASNSPRILVINSFTVALSKIYSLPVISFSLINLGTSFSSSFISAL